MTQTWQPVPASVDLARKSTLISFFALYGLFTGKMIVNLFSGMPLTVAIFFWLFAALPLSIFIPGLRRNNLRTYAWLCFLILMYFIHAVEQAFTPGNLFYGLLYCLICTAIFSSAIAYIRLAKKHLGLRLLS